MRTLNWFKRSLGGVIVASLILCGSNNVFSQEKDKWQNEITIYGWLAGIDGTTTLPDGTGSSTSIDTSEIIDNLKMVLMGGYEGRYNRWSVITDLVYMDIDGGTQKSIGNANASIDLELRSWIISGGVGYDVVHSDRGTLAVVGGVRYLALDADLQLGFQGTQIVEKSDSEGLFDGTIGLRGMIRLTDHWYLPYYGDIGTGGSDFTYQLFAGVGYRFSWGDIRLGYQHLSYELGDKKIIEDLQISGPVLGVGFRF